MVLIVYVDVLIFVNTLVDYFLLLATAKLSSAKQKTWRTVLAAVLGGFSSLYIFLPYVGAAADCILKAGTAFAVAWVCFGYKNAKQFLKNAVILFGVTCAYGGVMYAVWSIFRPYGMVINNSVVYFHISPVVLTLCTVLGAFINWHKV